MKKKCLYVLKKEKHMLRGLIIVLTLCAGLLANTNCSQAISSNEVVSKLNSFMNQYVGRTANSGQMYMGSQCKGFANWIFLQIFGVYIGPYPNGANYKLTNPNAQTVGIIEPGSLNINTAKALLQKGVPGDYIQVQRSTARGRGPHSMILVEVNNDGIVVFDCNSDGKNTIKKYGISWSSFDNANRAMSLYHAHGYNGQSNSVPAANHTRDNSYPVPIMAVPSITSGSIQTYDANGNAESGRYISARDECKILEVYTDGWCLVDYPSGSSRRQAYVKKTQFFASGSIIKNGWSPSARTTSYRYSNLSSEYGSVFTTDSCVVVGQSGNNYQLIYPIAGGYKLGWINSAYTAIVPDTPRESATNIGPVASGAFTGKTIIATALRHVDLGANRYIENGDICVITNVDPSTSLCTVTYPSGASDATKAGVTTRTVSGVSMNNFINYNGSAQAETAKIPEQTTAYPTSAMTAKVGNNTTNWYLSAGDTYTTINRINGLTEVLYYCDQGRHAGKWKLGWIKLDYYYLDVNGYLDGVDDGNLKDYGTVDVYVNGNRLADDVNDFYREFPRGSTYEVKDIRAYDKTSVYNGVHSGSLSGTLTGAANIRLDFSKKDVSLASIAIMSKPSKLEYLEGENLDTSGLEVTANFSDGSNKNVTGECKISGYDSLPGAKTVTLEYRGQKTAFTALVKGKTPTRLSVASKPDKMSYYVDDVIDLTGLEISAEYDNGSEAAVDDYDIIADDEITATPGTKTVSIFYAYNGVAVSTSFDITVKAQKMVTLSAVAKDQVAPEETFDVKFDLSDNQGIASLKLKISYNEELLELIKVEYGTEMGGMAQQPRALTSPVTLNWFDGTEDFVGDGTYAVLTFKGKGVPGSAAKIEMSYEANDVYDIAEDNVILNIVNKDIEIAEEEKAVPSLEPVPSITPEVLATSSPKASQEPEITPEVLVTSSPKASQEPEITPEVLVTSSPKASQEPETTPEVLATSRPKADHEPEVSADEENGKVNIGSGRKQAINGKTGFHIEKLGRVRIKKIKVGKRKFVVSWAKVTGAKGYCVQVAANRKFTRGRKKYVCTANDRKKIFCGLKSKKTYYIRVSAWDVDDDGNVFYGRYSMIKKIQIKK